MFRSLRFQIVAGVGAFLVMALAILILTGVISPLQERPLSGSVKVWSFTEYGDVMQRSNITYRARFPGVTSEIEQKGRDDYEIELLNALAANKGPDVFMIDQEDLPRFYDKILPLSADASFVEEFRAAAPDAAVSDLIGSRGELLGVPLFLDTLALYYNRDHLNAANFPNPPATWDEFRAQSTALAQRSPTGTISRSGAAIGTARNVRHAPDIVSALMLQAGNPIIDRITRQVTLGEGNYRGSDGDLLAVSALRFYTSFANPLEKAYTWNASIPDSLQTFAEGRASFYIGYASDLQKIVRINPHLNFRVSELPQPVRGEKKSVASYPVLVVSRLSATPSIAWSFVSTQFSAQSQKFIADSLGLAPARRDLVASRPPSPILQPFYNQVLSALSWPVPNRTKIETIFLEMIESVNRGQATVGTAVERASSQLKFLLREDKAL